MNIQVINGKRNGFLGDRKIYIGRKNKRYNLPGSALANPYKINKDNDRDRVVDLYESWLIKEIEKGEDSQAFLVLREIADRIEKGDFLQLSCYCAPKRCHGEVVAKYANELAKKEKRRF